MFNALFLLVLPYVAVIGFIAGMVYRYRSTGLNPGHFLSRISASKTIARGWIPWVPAIVLWVLLHLLPLVIPEVWSSLMNIQPLLITVEALTMGAGIIALLGVAALLFGRYVRPVGPSLSNPVNMGFVLLVMLELLLGLFITANVRWAAQWAPGTIAPYLWSLLTFQPDVNYVANLPLVVRAHLAVVYLLLLIAPFTSLAHGIAVPLHWVGLIRSENHKRTAESQ